MKDPGRKGISPPSEPQSHATVDDAPVERRPRVGGPPPANAARWAKQRIPIGLRDVGPILAVDEEQRAADPVAGQDPETAVRGALHAGRICAQPLTTSAVPLDAEP